MGAVKLWNQTHHILRVEAQFFVQFRQLLWAMLFVTLLPALYATIYLSSVWDPAGNTGALPVGLVNLDPGRALPRAWLQYRPGRGHPAARCAQLRLR